MHLPDNTSTHCVGASRLWRTGNTALALFGAIGCNLGWSERGSGGPPSAPEQVLSRAEAGLTGPAEEFPSNLIASDRDIGDPTDVVEMKVRLYAGENPPPLFGAPNQRVEHEAYDLRTVELSAGPGADVEAWELQYALAADKDDIDAGHPSIRKQSRWITQGARNDAHKVRRMVRWVYRNMRYQRLDTPRASDVLNTLVGDCTEYTHLFMALSRAAKIPARRVVGLAYTEYRGHPAFGYHAWAEVAIDGRWVPVDPTWNEVVADATHIKLSEGWSRSWDRALRHLDIEVLEVIRRRGDERSD